MSPILLSFEDGSSPSGPRSSGDNHSEGCGRPPLGNGNRDNRAAEVQEEGTGRGVVVELSVEEDMDFCEDGMVDMSAGSLSESPEHTEDRGGDEYEAEGEVDLSMSVLETKLDRSGNMLSPVVEDRLLRNIYHRYSLETTGMLSLSRFGRFTKEFGIAGNVAFSGRKDKNSSPKLVYGDVDVIFMTTLKKVAPDVADAPLNMVDNVTSTSPRHQAAFVPPGPVQHALSPHPSTPGTKQHPSSLGTQMTVNQFIAAVEDLAVKLYAHIIEEKTGTVVECLPLKQQAKAIRAAMDVMIMKKIAPVADKLGKTLLSSDYSCLCSHISVYMWHDMASPSIGLVPWDLIILDQTLTVIQCHPTAASCLVDHIGTVYSWFTHYSKSVQLAASEPDIKSPKSPMLYGAVSSALSRLSGGEGGAGGYSVKKPPRTAPPPPVNVKGVSFKTVSRFLQDYGVIPYLMKEPQLHR